MRVVRAFVYGAMALMLAAGWGFLYWQSGTIDLAAGNAARAALADLRAIDARWDDQVTAMGLSTRSGRRRSRSRTRRRSRRSRRRH